MSTSVRMEYTDAELNELILENIAKMLSIRAKTPDKYNELFTLLKKNYKNEVSYIDIDGFKYSVKIVTRKLSTIKVEDITSFLNTYAQYNKLIVFTYLIPKVVSSLLMYPNLELHKFDDLLVDHSQYVLSQQTEVLSQEDGDKVMEEYYFTNTTISQIKISDIVSRFYNLKPGQIIKTTMVSPETGLSVKYRKCVNSPKFE